MLPAKAFKDEQRIDVAIVSSGSANFRKVYPAEYRTKDGHYVRSKAELTIDESLYLWGIPNAYEKNFQILTRTCFDFHIPSGKGKPKAVYIEHWGMENNEKCNLRKAAKIEIYTI